ncbi:AcrR family transcriptional regulator [Novosphingobium chloroacetimidivorans]|uniref:AcrR family transcriptional regulator n=1 Tax=Novosphingobium chloroacetimidivorans TaxID=1428314 RepID=A0A7W7KAI5_9SPHN|nr:TetR/AcrR family transcriptional regulator [Novosphingobium chloroacetimidivorans]MBB4859211.1 AcrR family transcriptional regulator [Novosphingobium chloroacetimidivorans]
MKETLKQPVRRRGRPSAKLSAQITDEILEHATEMFLKHGYEAFSIEALSAALRIPKTTIYKRYSDKADLLRAAIDSRMNRWSVLRSEEAGMPEGEDLECRLASYTAILLRWATKPEVRAVNRLMASLPQADRQALSVSTSWGYRNMIALMVATIEELGPAAGIEAANPAGAAELIMAAVAGSVAMRDEASVIEAEEAEGLALGLVGKLLRGASAW